MIKGTLWWCILFCLVRMMMNGQDTIYKRNGELIAAKVLEINIHEISFKRIDLRDGPLIIVSKNDILKIKYATGVIDSFTVVQPPAQAPVVRVPVKVYSNPDFIKLAMRRGVYVYRGHNIPDRKLLSIANTRNLEWNNKEITENITACKRNKTLQYAIGFGGAGFGILCLYGSAAAISYDAGAGNVLLSMVAASVGTAAIVSSQVVSFSYKLKRVKNANKVMDLYNQSLR
ncbi:MAG: hypothetical protein K0S26_495 [Bacteroidota bacterium]|nr:hypothetical protein [Bacteroidota bacterium]